MTLVNLPRFLGCLSLVVILSGCMTFRSPVVPYTGGAFNFTSFPVDTTFNKTNIGTAQGTATASSILFGLVSFGNCSVQAAARNGNIQEIDQIDAKLTNILLIYVGYKTIVTGKTQADLDKAAKAGSASVSPPESNASFAVQPGPS